MDTTTLDLLGGKITKLSVQYSRKLGDGNFGSIGSEMLVEMSLNEGADADVAVNGLYEWTKAAVARNLKPEAIAARESVSQPTLPAPPPAPVAPIPLAAAPPNVTPPSEIEIELVTLDAPLCAHVVQDGQHRFKCFGGAWKKYGVPVYEEVLKQYNIVGWEAWPVCATPKGVPETNNRFQLPNAFQKVEVEVNKEGKPQRVHAFR